jgi:alpha-L-rhamnosidase
VEVTGFPGRPTRESIVGQVLHTAAPFSGRFSCSNPLVNQLSRNILWGLRGNLHSVPTDCPQRDERLGWMGDAQLFWRTACFSMDMAAFTAKWMRDVMDAQSPGGGFSDVAPRVADLLDGAPGWGDAGIIVPYVAFLQYGDLRLIEECWPAMNKWMQHIAEVNPKFLWMERRNHDFGDWVPADSETPKDLIATAYWAYDARLMLEMAHALKRAGDARHYRELFVNIRKAFIRRFLNKDGTVGNGSQTSHVLALHIGLLPEEARAAAVAYLVNDIKSRGWHLSTGFLGTAYLMPVLTEAGRNDVAYRLLLNETYPSWGYMIERGATTIWERWNGDTGDPQMNSFNHYCFGAVGEWLYRHVAGIDTDAIPPGFGHIVIRPRPGPGLDSARAHYDSIRGRIATNWTKKGRILQLNVTIPANSAALVHVPATSPGKVTESGRVLPNQHVKFCRMEEGCAVFSVSPGTYRFASR